MHGYTRLMLDKTPLGCCLWDEDFHILECNQELVKLFGLTDKNEFPALFIALSPKYQQCGSESRVKAYDLLATALSEGYSRTDWEHLTLSGELIPCEIICQRVEYQHGYLVAAYVRDLREQKAMIDKIKEADEQKRVLLDSAPLNCTLWDKNGNIIFSDDETIYLLGLPAKEYSRYRIHDLSPRYQPCGRESADMAQKRKETAFADGYCRFDWTLQSLSGEHIPCETILVRVRYHGEYVLAAYIRDLRQRLAPEVSMDY
jgi:PAS domain-containing protein